MSDREIIDEALELHEEAVSGWSLTWDEARDAREFVDDPETQWPSAIRTIRNEEQRPCMVVPLLPPMLSQVENEGVQDLPAMQVSPVDDKTDVKTAEIAQGILRHIEQRSRADIQYAQEFGHVLKLGFGFLRVYTEKANPWSDEQEIVIKGTHDPFAMQFDPHFEELDGSDAEFAFYSGLIGHAKFARLYPKAEMANAEAWPSVASMHPTWMNEKKAYLREFWKKDTKTVKVAVLSDGSVYDEETIAPEWVQAQGLEVRRIEDAKIPIVKWYKMTAMDVLERSEWELDWLPVIPILGRELIVGGQRLFAGLIRDARDPMRAVNYLTSAATELLALAPKNPYVAAGGQVEEFLKEWNSANTRSVSVLRYKPVSSGGQLVPPPQRQSFDVQIGAVMELRRQALEDLHDVMGVYPAQQGAPSNETSAKAIERRIVQGQTTNAHFRGSLVRGVRQTCRVSLSMLRKAYDTERIARIIGEDGVARQVPVNQPVQEVDEITGEDITRVYDLSAGMLDIIPDVGPGYATRREAARAAMQEFVKQNPQTASGVMDLIADYSDWPGKQKFAKRFREIREGNTEQTQQIQQLQQQIQQLQQEAETAKINVQLEHDKLAMAERLEAMKQETQLIIAETKMKDDRALADVQTGLQWLVERISAWDQALLPEGLTPGESSPAEMGGTPQDEVGAEMPMGAGPSEGGM